jgi:hypothetical protein
MLSFKRDSRSENPLYVTLPGNLGRTSKVLEVINVKPQQCLNFHLTEDGVENNRPVSIIPVGEILQ